MLRLAARVFACALQIGDEVERVMRVLGVVENRPGGKADRPPPCVAHLYTAGRLEPGDSERQFFGLCQRLGCELNDRAAGKCCVGE